MTIHIVNYASGRFLQAQELQNAKWKETHPGVDLVVHSFGRATIPTEHLTPEIAKVLSVPKGDGLWAWKVLCVSQVFGRAKEGDLVFYMDSGAYPTESQERTFSEIAHHGQFFVRASGPDDETITRAWLMTVPRYESKRTLIMEPELFLARKWDKRLTLYPPTAVQVCGGFQGYLVCQENARFLEALRSMITLANYDDVTNVQHSNYIDHRHDQAVLTEMVLKNRSHIVDTFPGINLHRAN